MATETKTACRPPRNLLRRADLRARATGRSAAQTKQVAARVVMIQSKSKAADLANPDAPVGRPKQQVARLEPRQMAPPSDSSAFQRIQPATCCAIGQRNRQSSGSRLSLVLGERAKRELAGHLSDWAKSSFAGPVLIAPAGSPGRQGQEHATTGGRSWPDWARPSRKE